MSELNKLISEMCPNGVTFMRIGNIAEVGTGSSNGNEAIDGGLYPFFIMSQTVKTKNDYEYDEEAIIIPGECNSDSYSETNDSRLLYTYPTSAHST